MTIQRGATALSLDYTGTTGAAGGWTISAKDGLIYVENRLGSDTTMWVDL